MALTVQSFHLFDLHSRCHSTFARFPPDYAHLAAGFHGGQLNILRYFSLFGPDCLVKIGDAEIGSAAGGFIDNAFPNNYYGL